MLLRVALVASEEHVRRQPLGREREVSMYSLLCASEQRKDVFAGAARLPNCGVQQAVNISCIETRFREAITR